MAVSTGACWGGHFCVEPGIFVSNRAFLCGTMHFAVEPGFFVSNECYNTQSTLPRPVSWAATWLHTWQLEQNNEHDWIIINNTSDLMPWRHFSSHGTRPRDTRTGNSASVECTVPWHQLISARVCASAERPWGIPRSIFRELDGSISSLKTH